MIPWKRIVIVMLCNLCIGALSYFVSRDVQVIYSNPLYNEQLKDVIYENIKLHNEKFTISFRGNTEQIDQQLERIMHDLQYEDPYVYENIMEWNANYSYTSQQATVNLFITYLITREEEQFVDQEVKKLARQLTHDNMSDFEKVKEIHDYVVRHTEYSSETNSSQYSPYTILTEQKGVCQAYAFLIYRLLQEVNIEALYVKGQVGENLHGWNLVKLGNEWYHVDATWNERISEGQSDVGYQYFLVTDQQMMLTHSWIQSVYPSAVAKNGVVSEYLETSRTIGEKYNVEQRLSTQQFMTMPL